MNHTNINARIYAKNLYEVAYKKGIQNQLLYQLREIAKSIDFELKEVFEYPIIGNEEKKSIIESLTSLGIDIIVVNMLKLLIDFEQTNLFHDILLEYTELLKDNNNIIIVNVTFAKEPSNENFNKVRKMLEAKLKNYVVINKEVNPSIIGGIIINYHGKQIDNSIKKQLENIVNMV